jgi:flavin-dependent dehydrogenase
VTLTGYPPVPAGLVPAVAPRRTVLDTILVEAARAAGAELREGVVVQDLTRDGERVTGVRGTLNGGVTVSEQARLVVGADGMRSRVAHLVQAPLYDRVATRTCVYYSYWADVAVDGVEMHVLGPQRRIITPFPTNDGLIVTYMAWPSVEFAAVRADVAGHVHAALDLEPAVAERFRSGRRVERFRGTRDLPAFFRRPYGPGWALVGDAGYHIDPFMPTGIANAFRSAELLVEAIDAGFTGRQPWEEALTGYERQRNEMVLPAHEVFSSTPLFEPVDLAEEHRLRAALRQDQEATNW